jgi:hypothetical protein
VSIFLCRRRFASLVFFLALTIVSASSVVAQTGGTGALTGTVSDSSGAVVSNATVTAVSVDTGQSRTATTRADGTYAINLLPPGNYRLKFEATGFKTAEVPSVPVVVTETAVVNNTLEVGAANQTVTVEGSAEVIQTTSSALGTVANAVTVTELPLNTRNYTNLLTMTAGANAAVSNASTLGKGSPLITVNGGGPAQNTYLQDGVTVNNWASYNTGVEGVIFGSFAIPPPDAITEFKIQTSSYDAGYGRGPGANVNVVTRSGTNQFHGAGFEFFRNTDLNANDWFRNFTGQPRGVLNSNQFGGVIGGPIKKDKLFFFGSYQETQQKNGLSGYGSSNVTLPPIPGGDRGSCPPGWTSPSQCNGAAQAFIPALAQAVCPAAHPTASGDATSIAGGINVICPSSGGGGPLYNINPAAISIMQLKLPNGQYMLNGSGLPALATGAGGYGLVTYSQPAIFKDHNAMGSFDYLIDSKNTLVGRYQYEQDPLQAPFPVLNANLAGNYLPGNPITTTKWNHYSLLKLTTILTPNLVNEAHVAWQRYDALDTIGTPFTNSGVGIQSLDPAVDTLSFFTIGSMSNGFSFGGQYQFGGAWKDNQFVYGDQISWTHGKHTIRTGFEAETIRYSQIYPSRSIGGPTFTRFADFLIGRASCQAFTGTGTCSATNPGNTNGSAAASDINNVGTFTSANAGNVHYVFHALELNGFVQDDFKVLPRLTLNLGLRWEYDGYPTESQGRFSSIFPSALAAMPVPPQCPTIVGGQCASNAGTLVGTVVPANYSGVLPDGVTRANNDGIAASGAPKDDFAPRVGFAWQPTGSNRFVFRGGAGMFYDLIAGLGYLGVTSISTPALGQPQINGLSLATLGDPWVAAPTVSAGPGLFGFTPRWLNPAASLSSNLPAGSIQQNLTVPVTYEWNANTQWEFVRDWVLEVGYVGSHGIHQADESRTGAQGQATTIIAQNVAPLVGPGCTSCALTGVTSNTVQNVVLRVPELGISAQSVLFGTQESYKFNSLQVTVRKQMSKGFQMQASYTYSRAFITQPFGINTAPYIAHLYEPNNNYRPQRLIINYVWNLPFGHPKSALRYLVSDWAWSGVTTFQDGLPMTITDTAGSIFFGGSGRPSNAPGDPAQICPGQTYGNLLSSGGLDSRVTSGLLGGTGFFTENVNKTNGILCKIPAIGNGLGFGNMGGGVVLGPGQANWDMALSKQFAVHEGQTVQFRSEFFNTFNHPQFANPALSASQPTFGQITLTSVSPRVIQLALKYSF